MINHFLITAYVLNLIFSLRHIIKFLFYDILFSQNRTNFTKISIKTAILLSFIEQVEEKWRN